MLPDNREYEVYNLPCGLPITYRKFSDPYIIGESGKKIPFYFKHGDISKNDTILDVGSQIGITALWASTLANKVIACECEPENLSILHYNCDKISNIEIVEAFVSGNNSLTTVDFYVAPRNLSAHSAYIKRGRTKITVNTIPISELCIKYKPQVVKMDCEGAEYELLKGGLLDYMPEVITFEAHFSKHEWHQDYADVINVLKNLGYTVIAKDGSTGWPLFVHASMRLTGLDNETV